MNISRRSRLTIGLLTITTALCGQTAVRVNVGGTEYIDSSSNSWVADTGCSSSTTFARGGTIANTNDQILYRTGRSDTGAISCAYTVQNFAFYYVTLRFAETDPAVTRVGDRVFNVIINGAMRYNNLDILKVALAKNTALDLTFGPIPVSTGQVIVTLATVAGLGPVLQAVAAVVVQSSVTSSWSDNGSYIFNNNIGYVKVISQFDVPLLNVYNSSGITRLNLYRGTSQGSNSLAIFNPDGPNLGVIDADGGFVSYVSSKRKITHVANLALSANDVCVDWSDKDDLNDLTQVFDSQLCRVAANQLGIKDQSGGYADLVLRKLITSGTGVEGTCNSGSRGRIVFVAGAAGVSDTLRVCRKDAADAYAWVALPN